MNKNTASTLSDVIAAAASFQKLLGNYWRNQQPVINIMADRVTISWARLNGKEMLLITAIENYAGIARERNDLDSNGTVRWAFPVQDAFPSWVNALASTFGLTYLYNGAILGAKL